MSLFLFILEALIIKIKRVITEIIFPYFFRLPKGTNNSLITTAIESNCHYFTVNFIYVPTSNLICSRSLTGLKCLFLKNFELNFFFNFAGSCLWFQILVQVLDTKALWGLRNQLINLGL